MTSKHRAFTFTLNNYTEEEYKDILVRHRDTAEHWIIGKEVGSQGTPHLQGYVYFKNAKKWHQIINWFNNPRIHIEIARGNKKQNFNYCSKEGNYETNITEEKEETNEQYLERVFNESNICGQLVELSIQHSHLGHDIGTHYGQCELCNKYMEME